MKKIKFISFSMLILLLLLGLSGFAFGENTLPNLNDPNYKFILIDGAQHLDSSGNYVSDIFDFVKEKDGIWSAVYGNGEIVRVSFENNLSSENDITIYARGNGRILVYVSGTDTLVGSIDGINSEGVYKLLLTSMTGKSDKFDLKIVGEVQFDLIVDPTFSNTGNSATPSYAVTSIPGFNQTGIVGGGATSYILFRQKDGYLPYKYTQDNYDNPTSTTWTCVNQFNGGNWYCTSSTVLSPAYDPVTVTGDAAYTYKSNVVAGNDNLKTRQNVDVYYQIRLIVNAGSHGSITGAGDNWANFVDYGGGNAYAYISGGFTAVPDSGYHLASFNCAAVGGIQNGNQCAQIYYATPQTLTATFAINTYTLTYAAGTGGYISGTTPQTVNYGANGAQVTAVANTGYSFSSWSDGVLTASRTDTSVTADKSVTASFSPNSYSITFNSNGGSAVATITQGYGTAVTAPANPTRAGYTFAGWSQAVPSTMPLNGLALTASWTANTNTITFNINGGTGGSTATQSLATDATAALTSNGFSRTGYTFAGWATSAGGSVAYANGASYTMGTSSVTLYAKWTANTNTITFNINGGTGGSTATQSLATDATAALTSNGFIKTGYTFAGWATSAGGSVAYLNGASYTMGTSSVNLYAKWTANTYTLTINTTVGSVTGTCTGTCSIAYDTAVSLTAGAVTGYTFSNWSGGSCSGSGTCSFTMGTGNTVIANYAINTYGLTQNKLGTGSGSVTGAGTYNYSTIVAMTATPDTNSTFIGWTGDSDCTDGSVNMTVARICNATFALKTYILNYTNGTGGTITGTKVQTINYGSSGTAVNAVSNTGYHFVNWSDGSTTNPRTDSNVVANKSVTANFVLNTYSITVNKTGLGSGNVTSNVGGISCGATCNSTYNYGTAVTFTSVANTGSTFVGWSGGCSGNGTCVVSVTNETSVVANYSLNPYLLSISKIGNANGSITSDLLGISCGDNCSSNYYYGATVNLTAVPEDGATFMGWTGGCSGTDNCIILIDSAKSVSANFSDIKGPDVGAPEIYSGVTSLNSFTGPISLRSAILEPISGMKSNSCQASINGGNWTNNRVVQDANYCYYVSYSPNADFNISFRVQDNLSNIGTSIITNFVYESSINVSASIGIGGIVGYQNSGAVTNTYFSGSVDGKISVGGLVGHQQGGTITNSFSVGSVTGTSEKGGFVGYQSGSATILNSGSWTSSGPANAVGSEGTNLDYSVSDKTLFYGSNHSIYTTGGNQWTFGTGGNWKEVSGGYPRLNWEK